MQSSDSPGVQLTWQRAAHAGFDLRRLFAGTRKNLAVLCFSHLTEDEIAAVRSGSAATSAGKFLAMNVLSSGQIRFLIFGFNQNVIGDGSVVVLTIQVSANSSVGPHRLDILNALGADPSGQGVPVETRSGQVVRVGPR